jgi:hypothetical protein
MAGCVGHGSGDDTEAPPSKSSKVPPPPKKQTTFVEWRGHGFFVFETSTGIRVAVDPFDPELLPYPGPAEVLADVVMVTHETGDANRVDRITGNPQVYRSVTAIGLNRGSGFLVMGTRSSRSRDRDMSKGRNVIVSFKMDGVRFAHLGALAHALDGRELENIGRVDVVVAPVGMNDGLRPDDVMKVAKDLGATILIPCAFGTEFSKRYSLGTLDQFLAGRSEPVRRLDRARVEIDPKRLPQQLEIWVPTISTADYAPPATPAEPQPAAAPASSAPPTEVVPPPAR